MDSETQSAAVSAKKKGKKKNKKTLRKVVTVLVVVLLVGGVIFACMPKGAAGMGTAVYKNDVFTVTRGEVYDTICQLKQMVSGLEAAISGLERSMERFRERGEAGHG